MRNVKIFYLFDGFEKDKGTNNKKKMTHIYIYI